MGEKVYLGDSVYAEFDTQFAGDIVLTTENGYSPTNTIYLEPVVYAALQKFKQRAERLRGGKRVGDCPATSSGSKSRRLRYKPNA